MPKNKVKRPNAYRDAPTRPSTLKPETVERQCPLCRKWEDCSYPSWYKKHGPKKCQPANTQADATEHQELAGTVCTDAVTPAAVSQLADVQAHGQKLPARHLP